MTDSSERLPERLRKCAKSLVKRMGNDVDECLQDAVDVLLEAAVQIDCVHTVRIEPTYNGIVDCSTTSEGSDAAVADEYASLAAASVSAPLEQGIIEPGTRSIHEGRLSSHRIIDELFGIARRCGIGEQTGGTT